MTQNSDRIDRRQLLVGSAALAIGACAGCERGRRKPSVAAKPERRDVPLRIALLGSDHDAESIRRGWGAVTEQPLAMETIPFSRADSGGLADVMTDAANKNDLLIYPLLLVPDASLAEVIVALADGDFEQMDGVSGDLLPALHNGAARYAGKFQCVPLGALQPALLSQDDVGSVDSWEAYDELVEQAWGGSAAEPSAPGWAGVMFLWRTAMQKNWLFNREDLRPLVDTEPYLQSLRLMIRTHAKYQSRQRTPEQIWSAVSSGQLAGGIGFPITGAQSKGELYVGNIPSTEENSKVLLDPFSPVISLSANCRQTAAAKRFIGWISGNEGRKTAGQQVTAMTVNRQVSMSSEPSDSLTGVASGYGAWLADRLSSPVTLPTLQILRAGDYYAVLDQQVREALNRDTDPKKALVKVANQWQAITDQVGRKTQLRAWRRAQGMRG